MGTVVVSDEHIKGRLHVGSNVEVKHPDKGQYFEGVVVKIFDTSQYTVGEITVFRWFSNRVTAFKWSEVFMYGQDRVII